MISEDRIDELVYRLNHTVLTSETTLDDEIALIQAYLFSGNRQLEKELSYEEMISIYKLRSYLALLENYQVALEENKRLYENTDVWARVEWISYEYVPGARKQTYAFETALQTTPVVSDYSLKTREEFLAREGHQLDGKADVSRVTYLVGQNILLQSKEDEANELLKKYNDYTENFIKKEVVNVQSPIKSGSALGQVVGLVNLGRKYNDGKEDLGRRLTSAKTKGIAGEIKANLLISERPKWYENRAGAEIYPSVATHDIVGRWREAHSINPDIPYPEQAIIQQDWYEISEFLANHVDDFDKINPELYVYIFDESKRNDQTVEEIANRN